MKVKQIVIFCLLITGDPFLGEAHLSCSDTSKVKIKTGSKTIIRDAPTTDAAKSCGKIDAVKNIIDEAIAVGAPTYNEGNYIGCYRIYEGAGYKILYKYGSKCKQVKGILEDAIEKSYGNYSPGEKAWIMRVAFDQILGVPTVTK